MDRMHIFLIGFFVGGVTGILVHAYCTNTLFAS